MTVEITVGPPVLTINRGSTFMVTDYNGEIAPDRDQGVFSRDTRFLSRYRLRINGQPWERLSSAARTYHSAYLYLTNPAVIDAGVEAPARSIPMGTLTAGIARSVERDRIQELWKVTNNGPDRAHFVIDLELGTDFADIFEVRAGPARRRENVVTEWRPATAELVTSYRNQDFFRRFVYRVARAAQPPAFANGRLRFDVTLDPGASWEAAGEMLLETEEQAGPRAETGISIKELAKQADELHRAWGGSCTALETPNYVVRDTYLQSIDDLGALRLPEQDLGPNVWVPAAGVPWYVTLFGRDTLIASLQSLPINPHFADGALRILARYQAKSRDDWRDAQPGKIMHEIRDGELAHFHLIPQTPYYGTWDATPLYLVALHAAWRWLGDRKLLDDLRETAEACLAWIDQSGDVDGDGFQEYRTFSSQGFPNMSWKDAADAIVYPDGTPVDQPKATCELQGYVYAAKRAMAEVFAALGDHERAKALEAQAADLKRRFNDAFWMEDEGTFALALDPKKRQVTTIASNAGHCLWTGIADDDKAKRVVARLLAPDVWSGWGIRTLSASHRRAYNPQSYQRGSVWPHDNAIIAAGMKQYGYAAEANQVARGIFDAAAIFQSRRLPEVFSGLSRAESPFPVQYRGANIPQAWAAGSVFHLIASMLGLDADVPNGRFLVNSTLPDWLPEVRLTGLRAGPVTLDLRFWRDGDEQRFEVRSQAGGQLEVRRGRERDELSPPRPSSPPAGPRSRRAKGG